jgi:hypothetical protein
MLDDATNRCVWRFRAQGTVGVMRPCGSEADLAAPPTVGTGASGGVIGLEIVGRQWTF